MIAEADAELAAGLSIDAAKAWIDSIGTDHERRVLAADRAACPVLRLVF